MIAIKANQELFENWQELGRTITGMASIVQNDMNVTIPDVYQWQYNAQRAVSRFDELLTETMHYVLGDTP